MFGGKLKVYERLTSMEPNFNKVLEEIDAAHTNVSMLEEKEKLEKIVGNNNLQELDNMIFSIEDYPVVDSPFTFYDALTLLFNKSETLCKDDYFVNSFISHYVTLRKILDIHDNGMVINRLTLEIFNVISPTQRSRHSKELLNHENLYKKFAFLTTYSNQKVNGNIDFYEEMFSTMKASAFLHPLVNVNNPIIISENFSPIVGNASTSKVKRGLFKKKENRTIKVSPSNSSITWNAIMNIYRELNGADYSQNIWIKFCQLFTIADNINRDDDERVTMLHINKLFEYISDIKSMMKVENSYVRNSELEMAKMNNNSVESSLLQWNEYYSANK